LKEQDEAFLGAVLENMEEGVVAAGPDGRLAFSNRAARTIHGLPEDEPPLERWTDYYELRTEGGDQVSGENAPIMRALRGEKIKDEEVLISPSNGPERYLLVSGNRMVSSLGRTLGAVVVMRDITERKRAEKRLIEVQEDERERIARDLHDAVLQDLSWAVRKIEYDRRTSSGDAAMVSTSEQVVAALRRAVQGVRNSIYDLRPREASKRSFAELLESVLEMNREISPEIEFESVVDGFPLKLPHPMGAEVLKVVQEALVNARRHSSASRVRIILRTEEDDLLVCVEDDGTGFEPEAAPGLGISGMRERAEKLGGGLEIQSHPAEGTRICLTIPRMPPKLSGPASEVLDRWNHMLEGSVRSRL
ncbi:MAG TPA: PAS domain-containing sensor histidine kinase, partial [Rubrobacteraceae bacterium]|nr:PAS domain-containing sensor histidine kinase [Rubrobacteraceae bacterium]